MRPWRFSHAGIGEMPQRVRIPSAGLLSLVAWLQEAPYRKTPELGSTDGCLGTQPRLLIVSLRQGRFDLLALGKHPRELT